MIKIVKHWFSLFIDRNSAVSFDSFRTEYVPLEVLKQSGKKSMTRNTFRIQDNESVMHGFCSFTMIEYKIAGNTLLDCTNLFSLNQCKKNEEIIYKYSKDKYDRRSKS